MAHITINFFEIEVFALFCGACPTIPKKKIKLDSRKNEQSTERSKRFRFQLRLLIVSQHWGEQHRKK